MDSFLDEMHKKKIMDHFSNKPSTDFSNDQDNSISDDSSSQTDVSEVQEHSLDLTEKNIPITPNTYDETAKWSETYYYDEETDDWGTPYENNDRGYYLNLNTGEIRRKETSVYA
ncbi:hypothetical protein GLOIN_2v1473849 [Rhizophagus irregularis DAOM 181602=DAOM 197198]|uniref:OCRE domain-containing protein n=3 Tax=Rhizophagus irregularis TaxID=588596 RepID=A0A2P4QIN8_RHIID|nr:hypothetical protein GLOIN_2v1473849 [Rhizophagus irregularis DAOM 181602=DAOM 197198]POG77494.1 hypothetical protein GLOIN_2v1473849 [Rhizophagus irregularis DAOM 181602=DAOM 197198]|eukprot:XP_025184360.1 hypothetical protein GLOIN_2v1473849 [Rhizophagus irregularis DAOM 181602=DAOM 197198]